MGVLSLLSRSHAPAETILIRLLAAGILVLRSMTVFAAAPGGAAGQSGLYFGAGLELLLAVLLVLGLFTRIAALFALIDAVIAFSYGYQPVPMQSVIWRLNDFRGEYALTLGCLFLLLSGAGPFSIDRWISGPPAARKDRGDVVRPPGAWTERQYEKTRERE